MKPAAIDALLTLFENASNAVAPLVVSVFVAPALAQAQAQESKGFFKRIAGGLGLNSSS